MTSDLDVVRAIAEAHLPDDVREQWLALLRPAVSLEPAAEGDPVVARLGGVPALPPDVEWPAFDDWGPLSFVAALHLAALSAFDTGLRLPASGRLLFFWFDGYGNEDAPVVVVDDPSTAAGSRVLLVPDDGIAPRSAPPGAHTYTERLLTGRQVVTDPSWDHPETAAAFLGPGRDPVDLIVGEHPTLGTAFSDALSARRHQPFHQVGGFAQQIQGPVEYEVATARLPGLPYTDPGLVAEAARWRPLLQVDTDGATGMSWGDTGTLYWLAEPDRLARGDLSDVPCTMQCC